MKRLFMNNRRIRAAISSLSAVLTLAMMLPCAVLTVSADTVAGYTEVRKYNGQFTDVPADMWYYTDVSKAYNLGIIDGKTTTTFSPDGNLTIAETIKLAALCHRLLTNKSVSDEYFNALKINQSLWYDGYLRYCKINSIVTEDYDNYNAGATRGQVAVLFNRVVRGSDMDMETLNQTESDTIKDVTKDDWYVSAVYNMYGWGIITGDGAGYIKPESKVRRSEIAAIIMRVLDPDSRKKVGEETTTPPQETDKPAETKPSETTPAEIPDTKIVLHTGTTGGDGKLTGITAFAGSYTVSGTAAAESASYATQFVNNITIESDNISFRLYKDSGQISLGILRGWLNELDSSLNTKNSDYKKNLNSLIYIWADNVRLAATSLEYTDNGDYALYTVYFGKTDILATENICFLIGKAETSVLEENSLSVINALIKAEDDSTESEIGNDIYDTVISDIKTSAEEIIFEHDGTRCRIIYGRGIYNNNGNDYRLMFIFKDGTVQTICTQPLTDIHMNSDGTVLYYTFMAPDDSEIQYGVNFAK